MTYSRSTRALMLGALALTSPAAQAGTITDFLDRIGGCRKPMSESFSYEISPYTAKPYGKALAEWTNEDLADFRAYFLACQTRRPDWQSMGDYNRNDAVRVIDTAMAELRPKVAEARAGAEKQRADAAYAAEQRRRDEEQRRIEAEAALRNEQTERATQTERTRRNEEVRQKVLPLLNELLAFTQNELNTLPPEQQLNRLDGYVARMEVVGREIAGAPGAAPLLAMVGPTRTLRDQIAAQLNRSNTAVGSDPAPSRPESAVGPYTDFEYLGQRVVSAMTNPLQRDAFRASLARGIDFNVGVSAIEPSPSGWLVQLSGRVGVSGTPGQGFFCRVERSDNASIAILGTVTPPYGILHVSAPDAEAFLLESRPLQARIVFGPCKITAPSPQ